MFKKPRQIMTTDNQHPDANWHTELVRDLSSIITSLEAHTLDHKVVGRDLRALHMDYYADKVEALGYHLEAKETNAKTKTKK